MVPSKPSERIVKGTKQKKRSKASTPGSAEPKSTVPKERIPTSDLKWRTVKNTASFAGIDEGGGMMMLEELDDVGIEWQEESGAKIAKFVVSQSPEPTTETDVQAGVSRKDKGKAKEELPDSEDEEVYEDWNGVGTDGDAGYAGLEDEESDADEEERLPSFANLEQADMDGEDSEAELDPEDSFNGEL
jgi:ATP-dependent RNA helicase DDX24/MAK5